MGKFQKLEDLINKLLTSLMAILKGIVSKTTPKKVSNAINTTKSSIKSKKEKIGAATKKSKDKSLGSLLKVKSIIFSLKAKIIAIISVVLVFLKTVRPSDFDLTKIKFFFNKIYSPVATKLKSYLGSMNPQTFAGAVVGTTVISLGSLGIYTSTKQIDEKSAQAREPASQVDEATAVSKRAHYYKQQEKEFRILNQSMPLYVKGTKNSKSIRVDFTFVSSNRYIKEYFQKNLYLIKDKLNSSLEPVVPSFPLEKEGQKIIKDKIKSELNQLIIQKKIKGTIEEVHIHSILAG